MDSVNQVVQVMLKMNWMCQLAQKQCLPTFDDVQFRAYSQNGEDGILLFIFTLIGTTNKKFLEICAGDGQQCNTANLAINHGWRGLMLDGDEEKVESGREFYRKNADTGLWPPALVHAWITRDNVNDIVQQNNLRGEIDLLSLDIDGNDYWIFEALDFVQPRVVIAEYQHAWGPIRPVTQVYQEDFSLSKYRQAGGSNFCGASLAALTKLAKRKGLRLVGCERSTGQLHFPVRQLPRPLMNFPRSSHLQSLIRWPQDRAAHQSQVAEKLAWRSAPWTKRQWNQRRANLYSARKQFASQNFTRILPCHSSRGGWSSASRRLR